MLSDQIADGVAHARDVAASCDIRAPPAVAPPSFFAIHTCSSSPLVRSSHFSGVFLVRSSHFSGVFLVRSSHFSGVFLVCSSHFSGVFLVCSSHFSGLVRSSHFSGSLLSPSHNHNIQERNPTLPSRNHTRFEIHPVCGASKSPTEVGTTYSTKSPTKVGTTNSRARFAR